MCKINVAMVVLVSLKVQSFYLKLYEKGFNLNKQRLRFKLQKLYWIRLYISNRRFLRLCHICQAYRLTIPYTRRSTVRCVSTIKERKTPLTKVIKTESRKVSNSVMGSTRALVSVKLLSRVSFSSDRGYIVLHLRRKVATKQLEKIFQGCKYEIRQLNSKSGDILFYTGERVLFDTWCNKNVVTSKGFWQVLKCDAVWVHNFTLVEKTFNRFWLESHGLYESSITLRLLLLTKGLLFKAKSYRFLKFFFYLRCSRMLHLIAMRCVEGIFNKICNILIEKYLSKHAHGFRGNRSCFSALRDVRKQFTFVNMIFSGDSDRFLAKPYYQLKKVLESKIKDTLFLNFFYNLVAVSIGMLSSKRFSWRLVKKKVNSFFFNVYLDSFDQRLQSYQKYFLLHDSNGYASSVSNVSFNYTVFTRVLSKLGVFRFLNFDFNFLALRYVRYAVQYLIGIHSKRVIDFLCFIKYIYLFFNEQLRLGLSRNFVAPKDNIKLTPLKFSFLNYIVSLTFFKTVKLRDTQSIGCLASFRVNQRKILLRLWEKGFCTKNGLPKPNMSGVKLNQATLNKKFNRIFHAIVTSYFLAENINSFSSRLFYILSNSLAMLYAAKYRWHSKSLVLHFSGRNLVEPLWVCRHIKGKYTVFESIRIKSLLFSGVYNRFYILESSFNSNFYLSFFGIYDS